MKIVKYLLIAIAVPIVLFGGLYIILAFYYADGFQYGTFVNSVYCTGKSVETINDELLKDVHYNGICIIDREGDEYYIAAEDIEYCLSYSDSLRELKREQNPLEWGKVFLKQNHYEIPVSSSFNEDLYHVAFSELPLLQKPTVNDKLTTGIIKGENGYELSDPTKNLLNPELAEACIAKALMMGIESVNLEEEGCYQDLDITSEMLADYAVFAKLEEFQSFCFTYIIGDCTETLSKKDVAEWISVDDGGKIEWSSDGMPLLDEAAVAEYVNGICKKYGTLGSTRVFHATRGEDVTIEGGTYGNEIDEEGETAFLLDAFHHHQSGLKREPVFLTKAKYQGSDDIGGTYVEVDMSEQKLYYYENYELMIESDVVTGNMKRGWDTPAKVCYVYFKQKNRTLRGANYRTFVNYWMAVYGNIGLHDATWRKTFGGEEYLTNGSHGCVNLPKDVAGELYEVLEVGTPVILFY